MPWHSRPLPFMSRGRDGGLVSLEYSTWRDVPDLPFNGEKIAHLAFCYTGTETASNLSRGQLHGTNWSYFWTAAPTLLDRMVPTRGFEDLRWDRSWLRRTDADRASKVAV